MANDVKVTLDPHQNAFLVRVGDQVIALPPRQFELLLQECLGAAATHLDAHLQDGQKPMKKYVPTPAIRCTQMDAYSDLGTQNIVTRLHIGPIALDFVCPTPIAVVYCEEVAALLQNEQNTPPLPS